MIFRERRECIWVDLCYSEHFVFDVDDWHNAERFCDREDWLFVDPPAGNGH